MVWFIRTGLLGSALVNVAQVFHHVQNSTFGIAAGVDLLIVILCVVVLMLTMSWKTKKA